MGRALVTQALGPAFDFQHVHRKAWCDGACWGALEFTGQPP